MDEFTLERQSSIENEPRTLSINQIEFARKAALYVVNTRGIQEALRIFTEGLEPVVRCAEGGQPKDGGECWNDDQIGNLPAGLRDIVSAPF